MSTDIEAGWMNIKWLNKGKERMRPLPVDMGQPIIAAPPTTLPGNASCLEKTVHGLWRSIQANRTTIEAELPLTPEISNRLFGPNTSHYPNEIMRGMHPQVMIFLMNDNLTDKFPNAALTPEARTLMASGDFHPRQLSQLRSMSKTDYPNKPGIYVRVYPGVECPNYYIFKQRQAPPTTGIYTGQTTGSRWRPRFEEHEQDMAGSTKMHYRLARTCHTEDAVMIPIILFDENTPMVRSLTLASCLSAAELTMVCLLKSWHPLLLGPNPLSMVAAYILDFRSAKVFANIMDGVKSRTGWRPWEIAGCNWQTPVVRDIDLELTWCSWFDYEKEMRVFRCRRRLFVRQKKDGSLESAQVAVAPNEILYIPLDVLRQGNLVSGQQIHVVVEFMGNDMDHPSMWVRFPRIGPNRELEILRSMAIRLEWTNSSGQWLTCTLTRSKVWFYIDNDSTKIPAIYQAGMNIVRILQCINYTGAPGWLTTSIGRVTVKEFLYDHLKQDLTAVNAQSRAKQWPPDYTIQQNTTRLQTLVNSKGWPTSIGIRPPNMQKNRQACDICISQASVSTPLYP